MRSLALAEQRATGAPGFPVLRIALMARGLSLGNVIASPQARSTAIGGVTHVTQLGGWDRIRYGSGIQDQSLKAVTTNVGISDPDGELLSLLETYDPRGSAANIDFAAPGLAVADWEPCFTGVLFDCAREEPFTKLILKTDDTVLRTPIPPGLFARTEWGSAYDSSIFGTALPVVLGIHDLSMITARGSVPLVNVRYDEVIGYWWALSAANMISIDRLYFDGVPQSTAGWSVLRGVYGGAFMTILAFSPGYQPAKDVIVSCDCHGPDELGGAAGSTLTGAPDQLRVILEEWVYRSAPLGGWRGPAAIIDAASWDAASEYFALHRIESACRLGADQNAESAAELVQSFLDSYPFVRIHWNELGQLEMVVIDADDVEPDDAAHLQLDLHHQDGRMPFEPGDTREVYTHIRMPFCFSSADQKFMSAYEAHDVAALPEKVALVNENIWSQVRLRQEVADLNPAPPADPAWP